MALIDVVQYVPTFYLMRFVLFVNKILMIYFLETEAEKILYETELDHSEHVVDLEEDRSTQQVESLTITILHFTFQKHVAVAKFSHQNRKQTYFE